MEKLIIKQPENNHGTCDFCHVEEGKIRPVPGFMIQLKTIEILGTKKRACQYCIRKLNALKKNDDVIRKIELI